MTGPWVGSGTTRSCVRALRVTRVTAEGGIVTDRTVCCPAGGQPGDVGMLTWVDRPIWIVTTRKAADDGVALLPLQDDPRPAPGDEKERALDGSRRRRHMRMHTGLHHCPW